MVRNKSLKNILLFLSFLLLTLPAHAEEKKSLYNVIESSGTLALKLMIVNPSDKHKQTYPVKAYLPQEVKQEDVVERDGLELAYDADKKVWYAFKDIELEPGQSVLKTIQIRDIWLIPGEKMQTLSDEAYTLSGKLRGTTYDMQAKLLVNNIEILLSQVFERQADRSRTTEQHIADFRENGRKLEDIELDLNALRRLLASVSGESGMSAGGEAGRSSESATSPMGFLKTDSSEEGRQAKVSVWVFWKTVFAVTAFVGFMALLFTGIWYVQLQMVRKRKLEIIAFQNAPEQEPSRIGDYLETNTNEDEDPAQISENDNKTEAA